MGDWLTIDVALAALLVTSFTCVGLLALWAATSPRHWFVRTAATLAFISPLLLVTAFEPFIAYIIQTLTVIIGVLLYRWHSKRQFTNLHTEQGAELSSARQFRFSLSSLLLAAPIIAVAIVIAMRLPQLNLQAWSTVALDGVAAGSATLVAASMFVAGRKRVALRFSCTILCVAICIAAAYFDNAVPSVTETFCEWPPAPSPVAPMLGIAGPKSPTNAWFAILPITALMTIVLVFVWRKAFGVPEVAHKRQWRGILIACLFSVAVFPLFILGELLSPDPIPNTTLPNPNAYDDFVLAGNSLGPTLFDGTLDIETATPKQLSAEVQQCAKTYAMLPPALKKPCVVPVDYSYNDLRMEQNMSFRRLARALYGKGKLAESEKRLRDAAECYRQATHLGYAVRRGGLLVDALVGMASSGYGTGNLYRIRDSLPPDELDQSIALLVKLDSGDETYDDVWYRDRVWAQRTFGWHGHLKQFLGELVDHIYDVMIMRSDDYPYIYWTNQATVRLLICELALARFHQDTNRWPATIDDLVPKYISKIPIDPLDSNHHLLKYRPTESGYVLYSVGRNCVDDNGAVPNEDDMDGVPRTGDLRLDIRFKPDASGSPASPAQVPSTSDTNQTDVRPYSLRVSHSPRFKRLPI